jgi:hypothetical protein
MASRGNAFGDGGDLIWRLSRPKNYFREALARPAVVVDAGETQVLVRGLAQKLKDEVVRSLRRQLARLDALEEDAQLVTIHCPRSQAFDFPFSRAIEFAIVLSAGFISL